MLFCLLYSIKYTSNIQTIDLFNYSNIRWIYIMIAYFFIKLACLNSCLSNLNTSLIVKLPKKDERKKT